MNDRIRFCRDNKMYDRIWYCRVAVTTFGHEGHEFSSSRGGAFANTKPCAERAFAAVESPFFGGSPANNTHALFQELARFLAHFGRKREAGLTGRPNEATLQLLWNPNSLWSKSRNLNPSTSSSVTNSECAPEAYAGGKAIGSLKAKG